MKKNTITALLGVLLTLILSPALHAQRQSQELAGGWKFIKQDASLTAATASWESVKVPHTWNALDAQKGKVGNPDLKDGYYRGACWYARSLNIPADWKGKRVFIRFEAASLVSKTYLNGELLGEHRGGFTAFCYELTSKLRIGGANELRVQVDNSHREDVPPLAGDFNVFGGIYRPVHLIATDAVCITPLDFASPGVYLTTKSVDQEKATVQVKSLISNGGTAAQKVKVETEIKDADSKSICKLDVEMEVAAGATTPTAPTITFAKPHLWQGRKDPYLYTATVRVIRDGKTVDEVTQPLGLRTVEISQEKGFLLNGQSYPIHGVNRHQDRRDQGWALTPADHEQDAKIILEMGTTAIRLAHYPQSEYFHDLCDRNGLLLWNEVSLVNSISDTPEFSANAEQQLRELILQRYNHPSAAFWGLFNELELDPSPPPDALLQHLKEVILELDPSRINVAAAYQVNKPYNHIPDGISFNFYPGWYKGMPDDLTKYINDRVKEVGKRIAMSEYGAGGNPLQHQEGTPQKIKQNGPYHPEEWQAYVHERDWAQMHDNPKLWGSFLWAMFDFASARRNEGGTVGMNDKGIVSQDRKIKKDVFYFYKANWTDAPMVWLASRRMTPRKQAATDVKVYSNCTEVELKVNGKSLGSAKPDAVKIFRWENVQLQPGKNTVVATGRSGSQKIGDTCEWTLEATP